MKYYIESFDGDDSPILGNLDGQAVLTASRPERCHAWARLGTYKLPLYRNVKKWHLVTESGHVVRRKSNPFFVERSPA